MGGSVVRPYAQRKPKRSRINPLHWFSCCPTFSPMSHIYRCNACRTRNTWPKALADYVRGRTCRNCGNGKFYPDRERMNRKGCGCIGYHFPHRRGSGCCDHNPRARENRMKREGSGEQECPF